MAFVNNLGGFVPISNLTPAPAPNAPVTLNSLAARVAQLEAHIAKLDSMISLGSDGAVTIKTRGKLRVRGATSIEVIR